MVHSRVLDALQKRKRLPCMVALAERLRDGPGRERTDGAGADTYRRAGPAPLAVVTRCSVKTRCGCCFTVRGSFHATGPRWVQTPCQCPSARGRSRAVRDGDEWVVAGETDALQVHRTPRMPTAGHAGTPGEPASPGVDRPARFSAEATALGWAASRRGALVLPTACHGGHRRPGRPVLVTDRASQNAAPLDASPAHVANGAHPTHASEPVPCQCRL